ncbi:M48 family peptidase [Alginatibacterium sediminis]|uniref:M48 family peptidase n=1 Tax=Alginatibacterium sediminis TaxID=2164068 RepID=A0A420EHH5_9ALTE|nr:M48 family metallopeptidase [Alginatibacterium sediminis]RKF20149.1 M48 family peptidase [Alginatibacterium sediminis]
MTELRYIEHYPEHLVESIRQLAEQQRLGMYLADKYPNSHEVNSDKALREFTINYKNTFLRQSAPLSKVVFDPKLHVVKHALGLHSVVSRVQGSKLKSKNEIRISSLFKQGAIEFLEMIVVHELAHLKQRQHNKAFYQLCEHMLPNYHQLEFDFRVYLCHQESTLK